MTGYLRAALAAFMFIVLHTAAAHAVANGSIVCTGVSTNFQTITCPDINEEISNANIRGIIRLSSVAGTDTITANAAPYALTSYQDGQHFTLKPAANNTGAVTLNINGIGGKAIVTQSGSALVSGDLLSTTLYTLVYYGPDDHFRVKGAVGAVGGADDDIPESGDYVNLTAGVGLLNSPTGTLLFDFTDAGASPSLLTDQARFTSNATVPGFLVFEGDTADAIETRVAVTDPTSTDKTFTIPNADSNPVQPLTCGGTDKVSAISATGVITCSADGGGGLAAADIDTSAELRAIMTDEVGTGVLVFLGTPADDQVPVGDSATATTWRTVADSDAATQKLQYDQATNTFSAGTDDDIPDTVGDLALIDTSAELRTLLTDELGTGVLFFLGAPGADDQVFVSSSTTAGAWGSIPDSDGATQKLQYDTATNTFSAGTDDDVPESGDLGAIDTSAELASLVTDETGSGALVFGTAPTITLANGTGLPISTGVSGLGSNVATFLATPSSANLRSALTDETGTGAAMFGLTTAMADDLGCTASQVVRRNAGDTAFECAADASGVSDGDKGDITVSGTGATFTIDPDSVALGTDTTGNYVGDITAGTGISKSGSAGEAWAPTVAFDFSDAGASPTLGADEARFTSNATTPGFLVFEGDTADAFESRIFATDPTADRVMTIPNADSNPVQPFTCPSTDKVSAISATGVVTCTSDAGAAGGGLAAADIDTSAELRAIVGDEVGTGALMFGLAPSMSDDLSCAADQFVRRNAGDTAWECATISAGGGDSITVEDGDNTGAFTAATDAEFEDSSDINFVLNTGTTPDQISATVRADSIALTTDTTGNYVASVADGTGIDGTASSEGGTYTPTLDLTEISSATFGAGAFTTLAFDAGATDPTATFGSGTVTWSNVTAYSLGTSAAFTTGTIELGAATDTTLARSGPGAVTVEGVAVLLTSSIDSSSELRTILGDEVGTGAAMFGLVSTMADDLSCTGSQVVRRNSGDTAFECATLSLSGDGLGPDGDAGDITVGGTGTTLTIDPDSVALSTDTTGVYVAQVADGTGIDGTANAEEATYTPTLDLTEISSATWGAGSFTTFTFDAGATDPTLTFGSGTAMLEAVTSFRQADAANAGGQIRLLEDPGTGSNFLAFLAPASITSDITCTLENDANFIPDSCVGNGTDDGLLSTAIDTSSELAAIVGDETGSGALVFGTAPDLTISATTETNIEAAIDTLANLTSIQGHTVTLTGAFIRSGAHSLTLTTTGTTSVTLPTSGTLATTADVTNKTESLCLALSDETTSITTGTAKVTMRMPYAFTLTNLRASVNGASSSGIITVDVNEAGATIMTTNKLTIDQSEETSVTAATAVGITDSALADDAEMTFDIDGAGTSAEGLKVCMIGHQ